MLAAELRHLVTEIRNSFAQGRVLGLKDSQPILCFTATSHRVIFIVVVIALVTSFPVVTVDGDVVDLRRVLVETHVTELTQRRATTSSSEVVATDWSLTTSPSPVHVCPHTLTHIIPT